MLLSADDPQVNGAAGALQYDPAPWKYGGKFVRVSLKSMISSLVRVDPIS